MPLIYHIDIFFRMVIALILGVIIGLQRGRDDKPAGLKTHALVSLGACLVMIIGDYGYHFISSSIDVTRLAAQVVSGVGFIGAGTILITKQRAITGLTSAAVIWLTASLGLAVGIGYYFVAISATILVLITFRLSGDLERWLWRKQYRLRFVKFRITETKTIPTLLFRAEELGCSVYNIDANDGKIIKVTLKLPTNVEPTSIVSELIKLENVELI